MGVSQWGGAMTFGGYLFSLFSLTQNLEFFLRILVAAFCGGCIGLERSRRLKVAGVRTHVIVCTAAALLMIVSKYAFVDLTGPDGASFPGVRGADSARVAAQVVSGVSFLGAGVIFKHGDSIKGLTTAAIIWATAGVGLALGAGMYVVGIFTAAAIVAMQILMHRIPFGTDAQLYRVDFTLSDVDYGQIREFRQSLSAYIEQERMLVAHTEFGKSGGDTAFTMVIRIPHTTPVHRLETYFLERPEVSFFSCSAA